MMMNMNNMRNMNKNNMNYMMPMNMQNMSQNNLMGNNTNKFGFNKTNSFNMFSNYNCKTVKLLHKQKFIQYADINSDDDYSSIKEKFKSILFDAGEVIYRPAFPYEVIERQYAYETLEYLLKRGVIEKNPEVIIFNRNPLRFKNFYTCGAFKFSDIENGDVLQVELEGRCIGAGGNCAFRNYDKFANIDKLTKTKKLYFSSFAPKWRNVVQGLNLFGKCKNKNCKAYNEEVIHPVGINKKFDFSSDRKEIKCPMCSRNIVPNTMGFWECEYQIKGEKYDEEDGVYQEVDINGKETKGDDFEYYDPDESGDAHWSSLVVFTGHRQKMKHRDYYSDYYTI